MIQIKGEKMKKLLLFLLLPVLAYSQVPIYGGFAGMNGGICAVKTFNSTDSIFTSEPIFWRPNKTLFTGAASLAGKMSLTAGTDTLTAFSARLIMFETSQVGTTLGALYDSTGWHDILANTGDYIPAENAITSAGQCFSVDLAGFNWWKPSIGIQIRAHTSPGSNATRVKKLELYLVYTAYEQNANR